MRKRGVKKEERRKTGRKEFNTEAQRKNTEDKEKKRESRRGVHDFAGE